MYSMCVCVCVIVCVCVYLYAYSDLSQCICTVPYIYMRLFKQYDMSESGDDNVYPHHWDLAVGTRLEAECHS